MSNTRSNTTNSNPRPKKADSTASSGIKAGTKAGTKTSSGAPKKTDSEAAHRDVIAMLKDDHKKVKKAFAAFEQLHLQADPASGHALVSQICDDLDVHAALEEEFFYPSARKELDEEDLVNEAEVEHQSVKRLIADLRRMPVDDKKYAATVKVLSELVEHHVKEEEGEMFPQLEHAEIDWVALRDRMRGRRTGLEHDIKQGITRAA